MKVLTETISLKIWQVFVIIAMTGFAVGNILAKMTTALGL